jgi:hypothetical protein
MTLAFDFYEFGHTRTRAMCFASIVEVETKPDLIGGAVDEVELLGADAASHGGTFFFMPVPAPISGSGDAQNIAELLSTFTVPSGFDTDLVVSTC